MSEHPAPHPTEHPAPHRSEHSPPHSRWLIRESTDRLAASYEAVTVAIEVLSRATVLRRSTSPGPSLAQRIAGRRGWPHTVWFGVTTLLTGLLLAWMSGRLVQHLSAAPATVAILPGLLLTLALAVTALQAAKYLNHPPGPWPRMAIVAWALLAAAGAGSLVWIVLWLAVTTATPVWAAFICGLALAAAVVAGMLAAARPTTAQLPVAHPARPLPRRLRAKRRRAERRLRDHSREWNRTAHQYAMVAGSDAAVDALARLMADDPETPVDGIDPYDTLILTALRKYRPAPLSVRLEVVVQQLHETDTRLLLSRI
jgi:hypothetical protein